MGGNGIMKIEYRRLTEKEITTFIGMRIQQLREEGAKEEINLVPALREYYMRHMAKYYQKYTRQQHQIPTGHFYLSTPPLQLYAFLE